MGPIAGLYRTCGRSSQDVYDLQSAAVSDYREGGMLKFGGPSDPLLRYPNWLDEDYYRPRMCV